MSAVKRNFKKYFSGYLYYLMNRLDRITAILIQLQSKKIVKAQEIADRFNISLRTVYRDVASLEEAGIPIIGEAGVGYSIMDGYRLPPVMFTKEEAVTFVAAEKFIDKLTDHATAQQYKTALYKIKAVLRSAEKGMLEDIDDAIEVMKRPRNNPPGGTGNYIFEILQSISDKKAIQITYYTNHSEQTNDRVIEPVGITFAGDYWYLIAWCHLRNGYRNFRLDRVRKLLRTDKSFTIESIPLAEYLKKFEREHDVMEAVIEFDNSIVKYIQEQRLYHGYVSEIKKDKTTEMTFMIGHPEWTAGWLLMFLKKAKVLSPQSLKDRMKTMVQELSEQYS
jgi:predicted DNA-binding transcriptional regulator YafY